MPSTPAEFGLLGTLLVGMFATMAWILRTWAAWMMAKIDERDRQQGEVLRDIQQSLGKVAETQSDVARMMRSLCNRAGV